MRFASPQILNVNAAQGTANGPATKCEQYYGGSVQVVTTAGAGGTVQIQGSNDNVARAGDVTNWTNIAGAVVTISAGTVQLIDGLILNLMWLRAVFTNSGSTGGTVIANAKLNGY